jgi:hypothetical protein
MKKKFILIAGLSLTVITLSLVGYAFAQGQPPPPREYPTGSDMMNEFGGYDYETMGDGYGMMGSGMMSWNGEEGPMHEAMLDALAASLELSSEEIESRHDAGETLWDIAEVEGLNDDEIRELMFSSHDAALEDADINGWFPPEQVEWMDTHMNQMWNSDYDHCGGLSGNEAGFRWHGMNW